MDLNNEKTQKGDNLHDINPVYYNITVIKNNRKKVFGTIYRQVYQSIRPLQLVNEINCYFYVRCG